MMSSTICSGVIGRCGDMAGVWIAPVIAAVMIALCGVVWFMGDSFLYSVIIFDFRRMVVKAESGRRFMNMPTGTDPANQAFLNHRYRQAECQGARRSAVRKLPPYSSRDTQDKVPRLESKL